MLGVIHVSLTGSVYTTIAVAVERCVTVCAPFTTIEVHRKYHGRKMKIIGGGGVDLYMEGVIYVVIWYF